MALYCEINKYKYNGQLCTPGPIKSMDAVMFLSQIPKFSIKFSAGSIETIATDANEAGKKDSIGRDVEELDGVKSWKRGNISMEQPSAMRAVGLKKRKKGLKVENRSQRVLYLLSMFSVMYSGENGGRRPTWNVENGR